MSGAAEGVTLLPCPNPWCEEVEGVEASRHIPTEKWHVCCDDCMIEGPWADNYELAVAAWNTRTTPPARSYADAIEDAAKACEDQQQVFLSPQYATGQPLSSFHERFACGQCAAAIRLLSQGEKA